MTVEGDPREPRPDDAGSPAGDAPEEASPASDAAEEAGAEGDAAEQGASESDALDQEQEEQDAPAAGPAADTTTPADEGADPGEGPSEAAPPTADGAEEGAEGPPAEPQPAAGRVERPPRQRAEAAGDEPEVVPGADLEPDLVLEEPGRQDDEYEDPYAERYTEPEQEPVEAPAEPEEAAAAPEDAAAAERPRPRTPMELAADARYQATGKRKTSIARVILKPGSGTYTVNGRPLDQFFPRHALRATARQPLVAAGYEARMDVVARLHGGGVSSQAGALRHGIARALVEADPALRGDLKRRGYLTRDPRVKERKKAGLKKARKRPQFSKR